MVMTRRRRSAARVPLNSTPVSYSGLLRPRMVDSAKTSVKDTWIHYECNVPTKHIAHIFVSNHFLFFSFLPFFLFACLPQPAKKRHQSSQHEGAGWRQLTETDTWSGE